MEEVTACLDFGFDIYGLFGIDPAPRAVDAPRPEKRLGDDAFWDHAEGVLEEALRAGGHEYTVAEGEGAFYAPKIDLHLTDSLGRSWQLGTVQLDYNLPERFGLEYTRRRQRPAPAGDDPPRAVRLVRALHRRPARAHGRASCRSGWRRCRPIVLPIADRHADAARAVAAALREAGVRVEVDERTESVGRKIREAELQKIPYMLVVGDREAEEGDGRRAPRTARATRARSRSPSSSSFWPPSAHALGVARTAAILARR